MVQDVILEKTDRIALVSADSDLIPPLEFLQEYYKNIGIKVYFPPSNYSNDLKDNMLHHRSKPVLMEKNMKRFEDAIMDFEVEKGDKKYIIPEKWKAYFD